MVNLNLDAVLDGTATAPTVSGQHDLIELHRKLLESADRGHEFVRAAELVNELSQVLNGHSNADPRTVNLVVTHLLNGLRVQPGWPLDNQQRFDTARGWLNQLRMDKRASQRERA